MTSSRPKLPLWIYVLATALALAAAAGVIVVAQGDDTADSDRETVVLDPDARLDVPDETPSEQAAAGLRVEFTNYDGTTGTLADFLGTPIVVNFFSSECVPCVTEMPEFQAVSEDYGDRVRFVGLAVLDRVSAEQELIERTGVTYFTARDTRGDVYVAFESIGMPTTIVIDADGRIVDRHTGRLTERSLRELIDSELA